MTTLIGLLIFHFCAISGLSLILGKYKNTGFLEDSTFLLSKEHLMCIFIVALSALIIEVGDHFNEFDLGLIVAGILMSIDLFLLGKYFVFRNS